MMNWQYIVVFVLLAGAVWYIWRSVRHSFKVGDHGCPDCDVPLKKPKKSARLG